MDKDQTYYERIHRYLSQNMTAEEQAGFEADIRQSEALRRDTQLEMALLKGIGKSQRETAFSATIQEVSAGLDRAGFFKKESERIRLARRKKKLLWASAIAAVCLVAVYWGWSQFLKKPAPQKIIAAYFSPDTIRLYALYDELSTYGLLDDKDSPPRDALKRALEPYQGGDYAAAEAQLQAYLQQAPGDKQAVFALAICQIATGKTDEAAGLLAPLAQSADFEWRSDAAWYLALCRPGQGGSEDILQRIATDANSPYQAQAKRLLDDLK
ncbi:MAG: tetratricopeptide repeat protein [Saprospiraceae bacterium]|nr:tetratricopeptide repeat protein [Saprospiraceae bacterium]